MGKTNDVLDAACLRAVFDRASEAILLADDQGRYIDVNPAAEALTGFSRSELCSMRLLDLTPTANEDLAQTMWHQFIAQGSMAGDFSLTRHDGSEVEVEFRAVASILPGVHLSVMRDVTAQRSFERDRNQLLRKQSDELARLYAAAREEIAERIRAEEALRKSEERLLQAAKMEAVGRLSGGIAHDFNNLLSVILGYSDLALEDLDPSSPLFETIKQINQAGKRAEALTQQLLAFSSKQVLELKVLDLNQTVAGIVKMLRRVFREDIEIAVMSAPNLWSVKVDPDKMMQVLMNLAVNARDAMPDGGVLTIRTENVAAAEREADIKPGAYVKLSIHDTGIGMDEATMARVFEPFFTTKTLGRGTGLGLATAYGVVQQSGGIIQVQSAPGQGSTFSVYLPGCDEATLGMANGRRTPVPQGSETILLVEDESQVRMVATRMLEAAGFSVITAAHGVEALRIMERQAGTISLVLTDVVMPQMGGRELVEKILARWPNQRLLYMSGYTDDSTLLERASGPSIGFVQKPLSAERLVSKVRAALDASNGVTDAHSSR